MSGQCRENVTTSILFFPRVPFLFQPQFQTHRIAREALAMAETALPAYRARRSKHRYRVSQLFAILVLRQFSTPAIVASSPISMTSPTCALPSTSSTFRITPLCNEPSSGSKKSSLWDAARRADCARRTPHSRPTYRLSRQHRLGRALRQPLFSKPRQGPL